MISKQQISITAIVAAFVAVSTAATMAEKWWPKVGWETPNLHLEDLDDLERQLENLESQRQSDVANQQIAIGVLSDQIRCRKWQLELDELYALQNGGDNSRRLSDRIGRHRAMMDESKCIRFGSY